MLSFIFILFYFLFVFFSFKNKQLLNLLFLYCCGLSTSKLITWVVRVDIIFDASKNLCDKN